MSTAITAYRDAVLMASESGYCPPDAVLSQIHSALRGAVPRFVSLVANLDDSTPPRANGLLVVFTDSLVAHVTFARMPGNDADTDAVGPFTVEVARRTALTSLSVIYQTNHDSAYDVPAGALAPSARIILKYTGFSAELAITKAGTEHDVDALYAALLTELA